MTGRLADRPGFTALPWRGLGTRQGRLYLLYSIACQPNPDQARALALMERAGIERPEAWDA